MEARTAKTAAARAIGAVRFVMGNLLTVSSRLFASPTGVNADLGCLGMAGENGVFMIIPA
jgi:hypothetical protein